MRRWLDIAGMLVFGAVLAVVIVTLAPLLLVYITYSNMKESTL
jgi:hypothetical protein